MNRQQDLYFINRNRLFVNHYERPQLARTSISQRFTLADTIDKAIIEFEDDTEYQLRSDAKFLLKLNFQEAVYNPLSRNQKNADLLPAIYSDTVTILNESRIIARQK